jgi:hypothetical protein
MNRVSRLISPRSPDVKCADDVAPTENGETSPELKLQLRGLIYHFMQDVYRLRSFTVRATFG